MVIRPVGQSEAFVIRQVDEAVAWLQGGAETLHLTGLFGTSKAPILCEIARRSGRTIVALTASAAEAESLAEDLRFFSRGAVGYLPEREEEPEVRWQRIACLAGLAGKELPLAATSIQAALEPLPPPSILPGASVTLCLHRLIPRDGLVRALETGGYRRVGQVTERGEYSLRGSLLDLFPPVGDSPIRAEFFGDELLALREFDVATQRSVSSLQEITVWPVVEVPLTAEACEEALRALLAAAEGQGGQVPLEIIKALEDRRPFPGMEAYLPYFYRQTSDLLQYAAPDTIWVLVDPVGLEALGRGSAEATTRLRERGVSEGSIFPPSTSSLNDRTDFEATLR
ncbi:MAG: hypothetical protein ACREIZ_04660, partial [Candidatus Methylomirabilales bacterium]